MVLQDGFDINVPESLQNMDRIIVFDTTLRAGDQFRDKNDQIRNPSRFLLLL